MTDAHPRPGRVQMFLTSSARTIIPGYALTIGVVTVLYVLPLGPLPIPGTEQTMGNLLPMWWAVFLCLIAMAAAGTDPDGGNRDD